MNSFFTNPISNSKTLLRSTIGVLVMGCIYLQASTANMPEEIGIEEVIQMSLANQYRISIGKIELDRANQQTSVASEVFETQLQASASGYRDSNSNPNSFPYSVEGTQQSVGARKVFSTGTTVDVSLNSDRFEDQTIPRSGNATLILNQSLVKGRSRAYNLAPIRIASKQADLSHESLRQTVIDTIAGAQFAYFDGLLAEANLSVAQESLTLAEQLLQENIRRSEIGSIAPSDILQAEAEVAARQDRLYQAEASLVQAKNNLKQYLSNRGIETLRWNFTLTQPSIPTQHSIDLMTQYQAALIHRPDYRQATLNLEISEIESLRQSHAALPNVDLFLQMSMEGWGQSTKGTFNDVNSDKIPDYAVGINVSRSLTNRAAKARKSIALLERNRSQMTLLELEQAILLDLDSAAAQMASNWKRLSSARRSRELAEQSLKAEQKRYQTGISSTFILIRLQTDLASAQIRELISANDYRKSVVEWERQTGVILSKNNIEV